MILNLITLATVKTQLGISDTASDAAITAMIPIVSNDVRRILNNNFDEYVYADFSNSSDEIKLYKKLGVYTNYVSSLKNFSLGQTIYNSSIPADTYLISYNPDNGVFKMSANATGAGDYVYLGLEISQWSAVSKMIQYRINKLNTTVNEQKISSESFGPVSKSYAESEINRRWNYPQVLIDDLGSRLTKVG